MIDNKTIRIFVGFTLAICLSYFVIITFLQPSNNVFTPSQAILGYEKYCSGLENEIDQATDQIARLQQKLDRSQDGRYLEILERSNENKSTAITLISIGWVLTGFAGIWLYYSRGKKK